MHMPIIGSGSTRPRATALVEAARARTDVRRVALFAVIVMIAMAVATPASAVAATKVPALKTLSWTSSVTSDGRSAVFIKAELPTSTRLPATVVIPVPSGVQPEWVGEIVGSDPSKDPTATYTIGQSNGNAVMTVTVRTSRVAQAEFVVGGPTSGTDIVLSASVPILGPVESVTVSLEPPSGSTVTTVTGGLVKSSVGGGNVYETARTSPKVGTVLSGSVKVRTGAPTPAAGQAGGSATATVDPAPAAQGNTAATLVATLLTAVAGFALYAAWANRGRLVSLVKRSPSEPAEPVEELPLLAPRGGRRRPAREPEAEPGSEREPEPEPVPEPETEPETGPGPEPGPEPGPGSGSAVAPVAQTARHDDESAGRSAAAGHDLVVHVKELAALRAGDLLSPDEYTESKRALLSGDARVVSALIEVAGFRQSGLLTPDEFTLVKEGLLTGSSDIVPEIEDLVLLDSEGLLTRDEFRTVVDRLLGA